MKKAARTPAQRESQFSQREGVGGEKYFYQVTVFVSARDRNLRIAIWKF